MPSAKSLPVKSIKGRITVPGDKSISHRSLLLASQCVGTTRISGLLEGEDVIHTAECLRQLGVDIKKEGSDWIVNGVGIGGLSAPSEPLYMGNSGTGARLMMGLVAPYSFSTSFTGDESLSKRPMKRVLEPLQKMGIEIEFHGSEGSLPMTIKGSDELVPIEYELPVASAQVKSAILLAGLNIAGKTTVIEKKKTRNHTELMLRSLGVEIITKGDKITITGQPEILAKDITVPADPSSAAFFAVAAAIIPGSEIVIENINLNPLRTGLYKTLEEMGADIEYLNAREEAGDKVADIKVKYSKLKGITVPAERAPSMIDEYPILAVAASLAMGKTRMEGLEELKVKESDRLSAIAAGLQANGVGIKMGNDWLEVQGSDKIPGGGNVKTHMDHRIAMSFLVMGAAAQKEVEVDDSSMIATSFPNFIKLFQRVGGKVLV